MFVSPLISIRTFCMFEIMEFVCILHNNIPWNNLGDKIGCSMAIITYSKVLHNATLQMSDCSMLERLVMYLCSKLEIYFKRFRNLSSF